MPKRRLKHREIIELQHSDECICKICVINPMPNWILESIDRCSSSKFPPCRVCGSRPRLDTTTIDVCADCFARNQQKREAEERKSLGIDRVKIDYYENELLRMRPELIDIPLEPVPIWYLINRFYGIGIGSSQKKRKHGKKISKAQRSFAIEKFSALLIVHRREGKTYCCKNRVKYLNLEKIRKIFVWRGLIPGVKPENLSEKEDTGTGVSKSLIPNKGKNEDPPEDCNNRYTDSAGSIIDINDYDYEPEEFDEPSALLTKTEKKRRKKNVCTTNPNLENNELGENSSDRKKRKIKLETAETADTSGFEDVEIIELEVPYSTPGDAETVTNAHGEPSSDRDIEFVTSTKIKLDPEISGDLSVPCTKQLKKKKRKTNIDVNKSKPILGNENNNSESNFGPEDEQSRPEPELIQPPSIANLNDANGKSLTNAASGPKKRSLWSVLLEEADEEELGSMNVHVNGNSNANLIEWTSRKTAAGAQNRKSPSPSLPPLRNRCFQACPRVSIPGNTGIPQIQNNKYMPPNENCEFEMQEPQDEPPSVHQVERLRVSNDATGKAVSQRPASDPSSDSDVESILTPSKRKAYSTNAFLDDSDKEKLRSTKRSKPSSTRRTNKPGPASRKLAGPASKKLPVAVDVEIQPNSSSPSPPSYRRVKKAARRKREAPRSYAETSDSDSDFIITSSSENDSDFSYDSDASSITCTSDTSNDSGSSSVVCIDDQDNDNADENVDEVEIQNVSDDDEEVRERVSASRDPRFQPVVILEHNSEVEAKLTARKITRQDWMNLEREREDYEEKFLGSLQFSRISLDYAVDVVTKALNWVVFPFGAKVLNRGRITQQQKRNPNGEEWLQIKQEFIIRHFKTALSITHWRRQWYCCQNRADTLDIKEYLERFWKIEL